MLISNEVETKKRDGGRRTKAWRCCQRGSREPHWTDGFGRYVHTDDPNFDPNKYLNGNYQQMTPTR